MSKPEHCRIATELFEEPEESGVTSWRIFRIMAEFTNGFDFLRAYGKSATFFGSTRIAEGNRFYEDARALAAELAKNKFAVITGGGPGIMEAANRGAFEAGGQSAGINIILEKYQRTNQYVKDSEKFHYFFTRKVMLAFASEAYIFFPGGFGTLDEFFEIITLIQTKKIQPIPVVLYGKEYWEPLLSFVNQTVFENFHAISEDDRAIFKLVDSVPEAVAYINKEVC